MDRTNPTILAGIMKAVRKQGGDSDTVSVIFASVEEMKKLPALRLHGRSNTFESEDPYDPEQVFAYDPDRQSLLIEGAARSVEISELAKAIVEVAPDLDEDTVSGFLTRHQPILNVKSGSCAKFARAVYCGPITAALRSYLRGDTDIPACSLTRGFFFRQKEPDETFIWIKSTPQLRTLLAILVSNEYTKAEIELLLKTAVDAAAAELGLGETVHVHLY